ncbi:hypothetical protein K469DRAFT_257958 [Zopfia rhizophila CBS 207.26]|uniref:Uncharacterized protein n=1 Tax=Zopfia rhizophila CBS 207.26 TaxID=1314779 RepID=A0A6A6DS04_9PEZI|nr:hypothetical protein K469DRAFT_257958 [Zopfia rhizophila CBS 207.26]
MLQYGTLRSPSEWIFNTAFRPHSCSRFRMKTFLVVKYVLYRTLHACNTNIMRAIIIKNNRNGAKPCANRAQIQHIKRLERVKKLPDRRPRPTSHPALAAVSSKVPPTSPLRLGFLVVL